MDQVSEVRGKTDIVALIQSYIPLKKIGANFKANCPFHGEKTPSFVVSPERQIWHCFGCAKGGDVFSFLMDYEHVEFPEALRMLADKAGVPLQQKGFDTQTSSKKELIYKLNALAAEFYHYVLTKHLSGKRALTYITDSRKISPRTIETYMLGFAPNSGRALVQYLMKKKQYNADDILEAGLATKRYNGIVDFFQDRLIFPLHDHRGNIIGFSGRILTSATDVSKYINTRETLVYHKGSVFFGLDSAKEVIKKEKKAIIMEGELDVIAAFQEGITNTVAIKGTALTEDQVTLLSRFATNVALCLDDDGAGQEAMKRSLRVLEKKGLTTTVIEIPHGKDPDEAIKTDLIAFRKAVKHDKPAYDVLIERALASYDNNTAEGKKRIGEEVLPFLSQISNEIIKEHYLQLLSRAMGTSYEVLEKEIIRLVKKEIVQKEVAFIKVQRPREEVLEEYLMALVVQHERPGLLLIIIKECMQEYPWQTLSFQKIIVCLDKFCLEHPVFSSKAFIAYLPQELTTTFDRCFLLPLPTFKNDELYGQEVKKIADELYTLGLKRQIKVLTAQIEQYQTDNNEVGLLSLQQSLAPLLSKLANREHHDVD